MQPFRIFGLEDLQQVWLGDPSTALLAVSIRVRAGYMPVSYMTIFTPRSIRFLPKLLRPRGSMVLASGSCSAGIESADDPPQRDHRRMLLCITGGFPGFDLFYVMTNGGPYGATEIPTAYLVKSGIHFWECWLRGSAMAVVPTAVVVGLQAHLH
ncbi:MAG: hypothetical protein MH213_15995 [Marinobacter sp.]|nr:hypothetical protein [Marinobacter sp.]